MNAEDVIESYVHDVAACLPRAKRGDVALELRSLLADELAAKAKQAGRAPDRAMAMELLKGFGRPAEAAGRYHQRVSLIDPSDTHHFVIWSVSGVVVYAVLKAMSPSKVDDDDLLLKWLGVLVLVFALMGWWRRRMPAGTLAWKPKRVRDLYEANRVVSFVLGALFFIPFFMYLTPQRFAQVFFFGKIQTDGLALDAGFLGSGIRIATLLGLGISIAVYWWVAVDGKWRRWTRWVSMLSMLGLGLQIGMHTGLATQNAVFVSLKANATAVPIFAAVGAGIVLCVFYEMYREWARVVPSAVVAAVRA